MGRKDHVPCPSELKKNGTCGAGAGSSATIGSFFLFTLGVHFEVFNSHFDGKAALELGPAPDVAFLNSRGNQKVHEKGPTGQEIG